MLPSLYREDPEFYENMRIQDLAQNIHKLIEVERAFEVGQRTQQAQRFGFVDTDAEQEQQVVRTEPAGEKHAAVAVP
jgi:lysine decarboxylase